MFNRNRLFTALAATAVLVTATSASAITPDEAACRSAMTKALAKYVKAYQKATAACHKLRDKGTLPGSTDCADSGTVDVVGKNKPALALNDFFNVLQESCASVPSILTQFPRCPAPFHIVDDITGGSGIDNVGELYDCLHYHIDHVLSEADRSALGEPSVLPLTKEQQKCHGAIAKGVGKYINAIVKTRNSCQQGLDKDGGPLSFACATADPKGKIVGALIKAEQALNGACSPAALSDVQLAQLDSCAADLNGIKICAFENAAKHGGGGTTSLMWNLPGECPLSATYQIGTNPFDTDVDTGAPGLVHDMDPILGYGGVRYALSCDADCANCSTSVSPPADSCRCNGDNSVTCSTNGDCTSFGGTCQCFYGPPAAYSAGGSPACVTTMINGAMTGSFDPATGDMSLALPVNIKIFSGLSQVAPCPLCVAGVCDGGTRNGLGCSPDATDPTFGPVSYDCPPAIGQNISGAGNSTTFNFTTGTQSIPFALACDPPLASRNCACSVCTGDVRIACNSDAECIAAAAGTCDLDVSGPAENRRPNNCNDLICSPDPSGAANEGKCLAGPSDSYCSGLVRANGDGILPCINNTDCTDFNFECPGNDCGTCSLTRVRDCFLDPIVAQGDPGHAMVGEGCLAITSNVGINAVCGWPGAYRIRQNITTDVFCSDGVTPFEPPGGSNCP
jgi:hypothetical protein